VRSFQIRERFQRFAERIQAMIRDFVAPLQGKGQRFLDLYLQKNVNLDIF